jgi:hypothetical protein
MINNTGTTGVDVKKSNTNTEKILAILVLIDRRQVGS